MGLSEGDPEASFSVHHPEGHEARELMHGAVQTNWPSQCLPGQQISRVASVLEGTVGEEGTTDRAVALGVVRGTHEGFRGRSDRGL